MTLKELQTMIKEELKEFQSGTQSNPDGGYAGQPAYGRRRKDEAEDDVDVSVSDADVDVDAGEEAAGEEDVLRSIYDLLAAHFDGGEEVGEEEEEMPMDDVEGEEAEDSELDEWTGKNDPKPGGKGTTGYDAKVGGKGSTGYDAGSKALQERFQKLANIIK